MKIKPMDRRSRVGEKEVANFLSSFAINFFYSGELKIKSQQTELKNKKALTLSLNRRREGK